MIRLCERIAGSKTIGDWNQTKAQLVPGAYPELWHQAFEDFFRGRIRERYLKPIGVLQKMGRFQGEGFSIVAIQCTLIEFLESTVRGVNLRDLGKGEKPGKYEYSERGAKALFLDFLIKRSPFSQEFTPALAGDFYKGVRCGLLHEARTKNDWLIRARSKAGCIVDVDGEKKLVFRDNFQEGLGKFVERYKADLLQNVEYQEAFIRKFNGLCE